MSRSEVQLPKACERHARAEGSLSVQGSSAEEWQPVMAMLFSTTTCILTSTSYMATHLQCQAQQGCRPASWNLCPRPSMETQHGTELTPLLWRTGGLQEHSSSCAGLLSFLVSAGNPWMSPGKGYVFPWFFWPINDGLSLPVGPWDHHAVSSTAVGRWVGSSCQEVLQVASCVLSWGRQPVVVSTTLIASKLRPCLGPDGQ